eukprot:UN05992
MGWVKYIYIDITMYISSFNNFSILNLKKPNKPNSFI